jgi:hypothetical protein
VNAEFVGSIITNIFSSGIQVLLVADQTCEVRIEQSADGVYWDVSDMYSYYTAIGNFGMTVMCVGAYYRVRVKNIGVATTTLFRLQTIRVPFVNPLPRSLNEFGHLQTHVYGSVDHNNHEATNTPHGEQLSAVRYRLIGGTLGGGVIDTNIWTTGIGTGGSVVGDGQITMSTGVTANNEVTVTSKKVARYTSGQPLRFRSVLRIPDTGTANCVRQLGAFTATDGAFFEVNGSEFRVATRKAGVTTYVNNGSLNGHHGGWHANDLPHTHTYEIDWSSTRVFFYLDGHNIHTVDATAAPWSETLHLPIRFSVANINGSTTNVSMLIRSAMIMRLGVPNTQAMHGFIQGLNAGTVLKYGPGNLHGIIISGATNNAVITVYDSQTASGVVIWSSGALFSNTLPFSLDLKGISFSNGLTVAITGAASNAFIAYE